MEKTLISLNQKQPGSAGILWTDIMLFQSRYENTACALVAIKQSLERNQILDGREQEFLDLTEGISKINSEHFTRVWSDPTAHFWVHVAYELVRTCLTGSRLPSFAQAYCDALGKNNPRKALAFHLADFKKFVLAIHYLAGRNCIFSQPLTTHLPIAIPGTRLSISGSGSIRINALVDGEIKVNCSGKTKSIPLTPGSLSGDHSLTINECSVVRHSGYELLLQPHSFKIPSLNYAQPTLDAGFAYQEKHVDLVKEALKLIECYQPQTYAQLQDFCRLLALKPQQTGSYTNISDSELPGAFICSVIEDPFEFADTLIHEFHHNRLFFIEGISPLLANLEDDPSINNYYSPWRDDLRSLRGLLHALYVYLPVCRFWIQVYQSGEVSGKRLDYVYSQLIRIPMQLTIATHQLARFAHFTEFGQVLFNELQQDVAKIHVAVDVSGLPTNVPAIICCEDGSFIGEVSKSTGKPLSAHESLLEHVHSYDLHKQCSEIVSQLSHANSTD